MKKALLCLIVAALLFVSFGCSTAKINEAAVKQIPQETSVIPQELGKNGIPKPDWVDNWGEIPIEENVCIAAGAKLSTSMNSLATAKLLASGELATYIENAITYGIRYANIDAGEQLTGNTQVMVSFEQKAIANAKARLTALIGRQIDKWEDADGTVWVLMSYPAERVYALMEEAMNNALETEPKEFQKNTAAQEAISMAHEAFESNWG